MTQVSGRRLAGRWSPTVPLVVGLDVITACGAFRGAGLLFGNTIEGIAVVAFLCVCPSDARRWKGRLIGPYAKPA